ncbi:MAG: non-ribosomal peptide synthetase, partial [Gammaproteobacteria bacterium]|nr:non-ribosomal peptide synthetase [Gammaproteobacteria bacterium]
SLGRPIANSEVHVLDAQLEPAPAGLAGEICIGGAGVARGYLNDPALTAQKFVPSPFGDEPGKRLYRTGDIGSVDAAGALRFIGRADHQVKLRGYRIELGEVESVLSRHPKVDRCVAVVREDAPGEPRLVAYFVPRERGPRVSAAALREHARACLPEFMVPSVFVQLVKLPQTRNGKIDRGALPAPEHAPQRPETRYVEPGSDAEKKIADIWMQVLNVDKVGTRDNFFDLGGHSLLMVQVHSRLREAFGKELSLVEMFRNPTVQALAAYYTRDEEPGHDSSSRGRSRAHLRRQARRRHIHR